LGKTVIKMNNLGSTGITTIILLISSLLIGATVASVVRSGTGGDTTTSEKDMNKIVNDVLNEITTYIQIKDQMGKYYLENGVQKIKKIAILVKPLVSQDIDISQLTIKLYNGYDVRILNYSGNAKFIGANSLFEHPIWSDISENSFGFIATLDSDRSLVDYNVLNGDMAFIIIKLSDDFSIAQGESITMTLFPSSGITKTITLEAPLPIKPVVSFE
jgi:archaellin